MEDHGKALTEHAQWDSCFVDFLREAPEATGDEPEDAELDAPKVFEISVVFNWCQSLLFISYFYFIFIIYCSNIVQNLECQYDE